MLESTLNFRSGSGGSAEGFEIVSPPSSYKSKRPLNLCLESNNFPSPVEQQRRMKESDENPDQTGEISSLWVQNQASSDLVD